MTAMVQRLRAASRAAGVAPVFQERFGANAPMPRSDPCAGRRVAWLIGCHAIETRTWLGAYDRAAMTWGRGQWRRTQYRAGPALCRHLRLDGGIIVAATISLTFAAMFRRLLHMLYLPDQSDEKTCETESKNGKTQLFRGDVYIPVANRQSFAPMTEFCQ
jgi:hypothetical protein